MIVVYKLTREDNLEYIGVATNFKNRLSCHRTSERFKNKKIVNYEILKEFDDYQDALNYESLMIEQYDTYNNGLNKTKDGSGNNYTEKFTTYGFKFSKKSRQKMSQTAIKNKQWKYALNWYYNLSEEEKKNKAKRHSEKTKGKVKWTALKKETVRAILIEYKQKPYIENVGNIQKNGKILTYDWGFCKYIHKKYKMKSPRTIANIIKNRTIAWKTLYEEIIDTKS